MSSTSQPHHRREDAEFTQASVDLKNGPVVAMKATDLDALSPTSASQPPNFLAYAQAGAEELQSQMPSKDSSAMQQPGDNSSDKSLSQKLTDTWEAAKEKVTDTWNSVAAHTATASKDRVQGIQGVKEHPNPSSSASSGAAGDDVSLTQHTSTGTGSVIGARGNVAHSAGSNVSDSQGPGSHTDMSDEGRAKRESAQQKREAAVVDPSKPDIAPTNVTNQLSNTTGSRQM